MRFTELRKKSGFLRRRRLLVVAGFAAFSPLVTATLLTSARAEAAQASQRTLTFAERVAYQRAIEDVYWRHRVWPKENRDLKPSLDAVMSQAELESKVVDYLRKSQALEDYWQRPIAAEQLQAEMDRMARNSRQPEVLQEVFAALGTDPFVIAECLARPALAERLVADWYGHDETIHGDLKQRAETELQTHHTVDQMKQTSGTYREVELVKTDSSDEEATPIAVNAAKLNTDKWNQIVQKLAATFNKSTVVEASDFAPRRSVTDFEGSSQQEFIALADANKSPDSDGAVAKAYETVPTGKLSTLQEDQESYYAVAVLNKNHNQLRLATVAWRKEPLETWLARGGNELRTPTGAPAARYTLPIISADTAGCVDDTWAASSMNAPIGRWNHTAVWTGSEMIIWGGENLPVIVALGGRYNPSTDTWTNVNPNGPSPRTAHTAVWTGTEMIVWGGFGVHALRDGGRYNPSTDRWLPTAITNASARSGHTAVWTGSEMIVWGGGDNTGGRYNPSTNTWTATATANAPSGRSGHTAVWATNQMIVWGGGSGPLTSLNTGGRYYPNTNTWVNMSTVNAPTARHNHTAVWTGTRMIVWGGIHDAPYAHDYLKTGGRYDPITNSWSATSTTNAPVARVSHSVVWAGSEMILWGGQIDPNFPGNYTTGGRYHPATNSWTPTSTLNAPSPRASHTAVWTGTEMIVWGGNGDHFFTNGLSTGGRYNPTTNTWTNINGNAPTSRQFHTAVWTGNEMIVWGGEDDNHVNPSGVTNTGGCYYPSTDNWTTTSLINAPLARGGHSAVWTGTRMLVWGGGYLNTGGKYNPVTNSWSATSTINAPSELDSQTAVWTGIEMIIWGAHSDLIGNLSNVGRRYNPTSNTWAGISTVHAPTARANHTAIWTGNCMIIWGGTDGHQSEYFNSGGKYNPIANVWTAMTTDNAPDPRVNNSVVWTGNEMIVWGGNNSTIDFNNGGKYNPTTNTWTATSTTNAPTARTLSSAVWTGNEMIVWSGEFGAFGYGTGARYNPVTDSWTATSTSNAAAARDRHTAVWSGTEMIIWGGFSGIGGPLDTGGIYCAQ